MDDTKIARLQAGESYIAHIEPQDVRHWQAQGVFEPTADMTRLAEADVILICVPTPLSPSRDPDLSCVEDTTRRIAQVLRPGQLIVLESTTYPGTTRDVILPVLAKSGLTAGEDYFVAYSPEREDPGNIDFSANGIPKGVGGIDPVSLELAGKRAKCKCGQSMTVPEAAPSPDSMDALLDEDIPLAPVPTPAVPKLPRSCWPVRPCRRSNGCAEICA